MKISLNQTTSANVRDDNGYGYAAKMCKNSLEALGHEVGWRDSTADVEVNFIQPEKWHWTGPYRIGYVPWESTLFHPGWVDKFNNECDEIWTPSPVVAQWMMDAGVTKTPHVYEHGVDACWSPLKRPSEGTFNVMHHGAEGLRKNSQDAINSFFEVFRMDHEGTDAVFWMKAQLDISIASYHDNDHFKVRNGKMPLDDLIALYHNMSLMSYPSWGEGFGLTPLQAMATGMPVLITKGWAPYEDLLPEYSLIDSELVDSPWPHIHPGKMFWPNFADLKRKLWWNYENRAQATEEAYENVEKVVSRYNWIDLTREAFAHLES